MVETIIGDPEKYKNLVPPTNCRDNTFMEIVEWVKNGNRLKKTDWIKGYVYFCDATEDIGNEHMKKDLSLDQKVDMFTQMVQLLTNKVNSIENLLLYEFKKRTNTKPAGFNNDDSAGEEDPTRDFANEDDRGREDFDENLAGEEDTVREDFAENLTEETMKGPERDSKWSSEDKKKAPERSCKSGGEEKKKGEESSSKSRAEGKKKMPKRACKAHAQVKQKKPDATKEKKKGTNKGWRS